MAAINLNIRGTRTQTRGQVVKNKSQVNLKDLCLWEYQKMHSHAVFELHNFIFEDFWEILASSRRHHLHGQWGIKYNS